MCRGSARESEPKSVIIHSSILDSWLSVARSEFVFVSTGSREHVDPESSRAQGRMSEILGELFTVRGYGRFRARQELEEAWNAAVGEPLCRQTQLGEVRRGVLNVTVSHPALLEELSAFQKPSLLAALRSGASTRRSTTSGFGWESWVRRRTAGAVTAESSPAPSPSRRPVPVRGPARIGPRRRPRSRAAMRPGRPRPHRIASGRMGRAGMGAGCLPGT